MRRAAIAACIAVPLALTACTLLVSTSDLDNGAAPPASSDGAPGIDGGTSDAAKADAAPKPGPDGSAAADGATSPCATAHFFCDDFDTGNPDVTMRWTSALEGAGPLTLDTTRSVSPPRSLLVALKGGGGKETSELRQDFSTAKTTFHFGFDSFVPTTTNRGNYEEDLVELDFLPAPSGASDEFVSLSTYDSVAQLERYLTPSDGGATASEFSKFTLPHDRWVHIDVTLDFTTSAPMLKLAVDGTVVAHVDLAPQTRIGVSVGIGATYTESLTDAWNIWFDNVVAD